MNNGLLFVPGWTKEIDVMLANGMSIHQIIVDPTNLFKLRYEHNLQKICTHILIKYNNKYHTELSNFLKSCTVGKSSIRYAYGPCGVRTVLTHLKRFKTFISFHINNSPYVEDIAPIIARRETVARWIECGYAPTKYHRQRANYYIACQIRREIGYVDARGRLVVDRTAYRALFNARRMNIVYRLTRFDNLYPMFASEGTLKYWSSQESYEHVIAYEIARNHYLQNLQLFSGLMSQEIINEIGALFQPHAQICS